MVDDILSYQCSRKDPQDPSTVLDDMTVVKLNHSRPEYYSVDSGRSSGSGSPSPLPSLTLSSSYPSSIAVESLHIRLEELSLRQDRLQETMDDSFNFLTDRLNELESKLAEDDHKNFNRVTSLQSSVKQLFTQLVRKIINIVQSIPHSRSRMHSRTGMMRGRETVHRE